MELDQKWLRRIVFVLVVAGIIWWLFSRNSAGEGGISSRVKGQAVEKKEVSGGAFTIVGEKINQLLPSPVKEQISKLESRLEKRSSQVIEETEVVRQLKTTIEQTLEEAEGFPEKQKKEIKKEVIRQVCDQLLEEAEE